MSIESKVRLRKLSSFALIGAAVFVGVQLVLSFLVDILYWEPLYASTFTLAVSIWVNYKLNQNFTWHHHQSRGQAFRFIVARVATMILSLIIIRELLQMNLDYRLANALGVIAGMIANFLLADYWVFQSRSGRRESLALGWQNATFVVLAVVGFVGVLRFVTAGLFIPLLFVTMSILGILVALLFLISLMYGYRDGKSFNELHPPVPRGVYKEKFAVLLPARKELDVYPQTLLNAAWTQSGHPDHRFFAVVCDDDRETIRVALTAMRVVNDWWISTHLHDEFPTSHAQLSATLDARMSTLQEKLDDGALTQEELAYIDRAIEQDFLLQLIVFPLNGRSPSKPLQLNHAFNLLKRKDFTAFTIVDAESMIQPRLFETVDQAFQDNPEVSVVQGAVQLMDPTYRGSRWQRTRQYVRRWYAWLNLLEYYRHNSGQMPFQVDNRFVPLCGNTVFIRTHKLELTGGWPLTLTEDCHLGLILSTLADGRVYSFYDPALATQEETPPTLDMLIRQRTRWTQGFLQSFISGEWRSLPTTRQRTLAVWILANPFFQAMAAPLLPLTVAIMIGDLFSSPPVLVLIMFIPLFAMVVGGVLQLIQLHDFGQHFGRRIPWYVYPQVILTLFPYQFVLSYAAFRAVLRQFRGRLNWEQTARSGDLLITPLPATDTPS